MLKNGTIQDLCGALEPLANVPKNRMIVGDVYANKFFKIYEQTEPISSIRERDEIYVYLETALFFDKTRKIIINYPFFLLLEVMSWPQA